MTQRELKRAQTRVRRLQACRRAAVWLHKDAGHFDDELTRERIAFAWGNVVDQCDASLDWAERELLRLKQQ